MKPLGEEYSHGSHILKLKRIESSVHQKARLHFIEVTVEAITKWLQGHICLIKPDKICPKSFLVVINNSITTTTAKPRGRLNTR